MSSQAASSRTAESPEVFEWTVNQTTRTANEHFNYVVNNRREIVGIQYNTGENNHMVRLDIPERPAEQVNIVKFGEGAEYAQGRRYNGGAVGKFIYGYIGYKIETDQRVHGTFIGILDNTFPALIVGVLDVQNDPQASSDRITAVLARHPQGWITVAGEATSKVGVLAITTGADLSHTLDTDAHYNDNELTVVARLNDEQGGAAGNMATVTFKINTGGQPPSGAFNLPSANASVEYHLDGAGESGKGRIEALQHDPATSTWSAQFSFQAHSHTFEGFFTVQPAS